MQPKYLRSTGLMGSAALILCSGYVSTALAQADTSVQLEEVVITAEHRAEDIQKTAIPMTAITGAQIAAKGQTSLDEVLRDAPSLKIQSSPQGADIVVRGVGGNAAGGISQDPDVSVFTDSVYSGLAAQNIGNIYDVQRVEILRGPQGTLYGRNSAGGAVNILTNDPGAEFGAGINAGIGSLNLRRADGFVNLPVSPTFGIRVAFDRDLRDGYYKRSNLAVLNGTRLDGRAGEVDNTGVRVKAKWAPSDAFSLLARIDYSRQKGLSMTTVPIKDSGGPPPFLPVNPADPWDPNAVGVTSAPVGNDNKFYTYSLQADADLGFGVLTVIPTYTTGTQFQYGCGGLFAPASAVCADASTTTNKQRTFEARLASEASSALKWVAGVYYLDSKADQQGMAPGNTVTWFAQQSNNKRPASSYAGFAQTTIPFSDALRATFGGRYTVDEKKIFYGVCSSTNGVTCGPSSTGAGTYISPAGNRSNKYNSFTYKAGLEYDLSDSAMAYLQVSKGYKAGGYSTATIPPVAYDPEGLINYELGVKSRMLDNTLELNADIYFYQYHNQQIELHVSSPWTGIIPDQYVPPAYLPGGASANTNDLILDVNAGNSQYKGFELQAKYQLTAHDQFSLEAAYNRAVYGHFVVPTSAGPPPGINFGTATSFDLTGKQEAHAPLWSGNVGYQHAWDIAGGALTLQGNMRLQTSNYTTIQQWFANGNTLQKGYHQTDANLQYASAGDKWSVGIWGKNLENNAVVTYVYPLFKQTLDISRTYGATASIKF